MKINEIISEWIIMPQSIKPMGLIKKPGGGFDFKNKGNNRANELDEGLEIAQLVGKSIAHLEMYVELASDVKKQYPTLSPFTKIKAEQVLRSVPSLVKDLRKPGIWNEEDAAGVGIITKQNTTQDVKPGDEYKNVKKLHLSK
jgi:hypothetical protein